MRAIADWVRAWRRRAASWSQQGDAAFHDELFGGAQAAVLDFSYVGYATVRRFADLVEPELVGARHVVDFGAGVGEITCELARRLPELRFLGLDHSSAGITRANDLAKRLGLANVTFESLRVDRDEIPPADVGLFLDSFHHMPEPSEVVARLSAHIPRLVLIEPHGDWKGSWDQSVNLDWLPLELEKLRLRLDSDLGVVSGENPGGLAHPAHDRTGEAVEHRYSLEELFDLLHPYDLTVHGTVSGLGRYPPRPRLDTPSRRLLNKTLYDLLMYADSELANRRVDVAAKHWVIVARRADQTRALPPPMPVLPNREPKPSLSGPFDVRCSSYDGPRWMRRGQTHRVRLSVTNNSYRTLPAGSSFGLSYHWRRLDGSASLFDGVRTRFPCGLSPGATVRAEMAVEAPERRGLHVLALDVVEEGESWASDWGVPPLDVKILVW